MWRETESLLLNSEGETFTVVLEFFPSETKECIMKALQEEK
jgi:hypothetical protein